jgi:hypothetical protein
MSTRQARRGARGSVARLELVDFIGVPVTRLRVLDDHLEGGEARPLLLVELVDWDEVPVGVEEGADVDEGDAAILLEHPPDKETNRGVANKIATVPERR